HREDQGGGGEGLLAARKQRQGLWPLARRVGDDLEPGLERILGFDKLQLRRAATEQYLEQILEMPIHRVEGAGQPFRALAVQARDRLAQSLDRLGEVVAFASELGAFRLDRAKLLVGKQIHAAE